MMSRSAPSAAGSLRFGPLHVPRLVRAVVVFTASLLLLTACWVLTRRFHGALHEPLPGPNLLLLGCVLAAPLIGSGPFAGRLVGRRGGAGTPRLRAPRVMLTIAALLAGCAVSLPGTPLVSLGTFWLLVGLGILQAWAPSLRVRRWLPGVRDRADDTSRDGACRQTFGAVPVSEPRYREALPDESEEDIESEEGLLPAGVSQRIVRARDERGAEIVSGSLRCEFAAGQRQQSVHIAFCPPLQSIPEFNAEQLAGPDAQIKPAMVETFGAGLELKLASPSREPAEVQIQFFAFEKSTAAADS